MAFDKDAFISALDSMSVMELNDLVKAIEEKFGVSAAAAVAVQLVLKNGKVEHASIGLTNVAPTALEAVAAMKFLTGKTPDEKTILETAKLCAQAAAPSADRRGSVEYKKEMTRVLAARAIKAALERAGRK